MCEPVKTVINKGQYLWYMHFPSGAASRCVGVCVCVCAIESAPPNWVWTSMRLRHRKNEHYLTSLDARCPDSMANLRTFFHSTNSNQNHIPYLYRSIFTFYGLAVYGLRVLTYVYSPYSLYTPQWRVCPLNHNAVLV